MFTFNDTVDKSWIVAQLNGSPLLLEAVSEIEREDVTPSNSCNTLRLLFMYKLLRKCVSYIWLPSLDESNSQKKFNIVGRYDLEGDENKKDKNKGKKNHHVNVNVNGNDPRHSLRLTKEQVLAELVHDSTEVKKCMSMTNPDRVKQGKDLELRFRHYLDTCIY